MAIRYSLNTNNTLNNNNRYIAELATWKANIYNKYHDHCSPLISLLPSSKDNFRIVMGPDILAA
jgi:hypothetical protein